MNLVTKDNVQSYNNAVYQINKNQKNNTKKLASAYKKMITNNNVLHKSLDNMRRTLKTLKMKVYMNQSLIDNRDKSNNFTMPNL